MNTVGFIPDYQFLPAIRGGTPAPAMQSGVALGMGPTGNTWLMVVMLLGGAALSYVLLSKPSPRRRSLRGASRRRRRRRR